jgi:signal peptidase I
MRKEERTMRMISNRRAIPLAVVATWGMLLVARWLLRFVTVTGFSMRPVLDEGDHVIALRTPPGRIRRGSLVVCRDPLEGRTVVARARDAVTGRVIELHPQLTDYYVKRVVGTPGERVWPRAGLIDPPPGSGADGSVVVPPESFWLEGETSLSQDSTLWGPVRRERILGVVIWSSGADRNRPPTYRRTSAKHPAGDGNT